MRDFLPFPIFRLIEHIEKSKILHISYLTLYEGAILSENF